VKKRRDESRHRMTRFVKPRCEQITRMGGDQTKRWLRAPFEGAGIERIIVTTEQTHPRLSMAERDRRWSGARAFMDKHGVDALLIFGERDGSGNPQVSPDVYFTGERAGGTLVFPRDREPIAHVWGTNSLADHMEAQRRGEESWLAPEQYRLGLRPERLADTIGELGLRSGHFGVFGLEPAGPFYPCGVVPYGVFAGIVEALPQARFTPLWGSFLEILLSLSDEELGFVARSAAAGERMCQAALEVTRAGATEAEIYAAVAEACFAEGAHHWWTIIVSGQDSLAWGPPRHQYRAGPPRQIEPGDVVMLELFPVYGGYETQQQLTIAVGEVHPDTQRAAEVARASYDAGLALVRPGVALGDVVEAINEPQVKAGGWNLTPNIHTLPLQAAGGHGFSPEIVEMQRYVGVSAIPSLRPELRLAAGMVFAFEPNCVIGRHRVNLGGTVLLTDDGCRELNELPNQLQHV
jgi:Xaa-Pro aminopeptidase